MVLALPLALAVHYVLLAAHGLDARGAVHVRSPLMGRPNVYNILAAVGVTAALGLPLEAIEKHDLLVATPYGFQGEERDFMFLSLAVDPKSHPQAFRHLNQPDVFNVAITRARSHQVVFASVDPPDLPAGSLAARYLSELSTPAEAALESSDIPKDGFLDRVAFRLSSSGFRVYRAFLVAGTIVDLVVEREGKVFGIDLIGQSGPLGTALDLERYRMLRRAGLSVFPLSFESWVSSESSCLTALLHAGLPRDSH